MQTRPGILVFSDLDGTLLDHASYSWTPAAPALERLRELGAGLVLSTSKTAAEVAPLRAALGFAGWPAIVENGGGLLEPSGEAGDGIGDYDRIRDRLKDLPPGFTGFGDMTVEQVAGVTGLSRDAAALARDRRFSEPGLWTGTPEHFETFRRAAQEAGLSLQQGGRFLSLSFGGTKAQRMADLIARYAPAHTIALGDAPNDIGMLEGADIGVIVANPVGRPLPRLPAETTGRIRRTTRAGPHGWAEAMTDILDELTAKRDPVRHG